MIRYIRQSLLFLLVMTVLTGIAYPLAITGLAHVLFPWQAEGSLIVRNGAVVGSERIGQAFSSDRYFHGRPSAAGAGYDALASGGSNLGPTSPVFLQRVQRTAEGVRMQEGLPVNAELPSDLVLASGSGLDPHISLESAMLQVPRVARSRSIPEGDVARMVENLSKSTTYGIQEAPRIHVLELNLALDSMQ